MERQNLPRRRVESRLFISILSLLLITIICTFESYQIYYSEKRNQLKAYVDSQGKLIEALFINESDIDRVMDHVVERAASFNEDFIHSRSNVDIQFILYPLFERNEAAKKSRALAWSQNSSKYKRKVWASSDPQTDMITKKILNQSGTSLSWQLFNPDDLLAHKLLPQLNMRLVGLVSVEEINKVFIHLFFKLLLIGILIGSSALLFYRYLEKRFGRFEDAARNKIEELLTNLNMFKKGMDAHSMMCKTDPSGRILQVNDRFCQTTKYSEDQLIGQNFSILSSGIHDKTFWKNFWDWINQGKVWHGSLQNKRQDGTYFWAETTVVPIDAPHRNQSGFIAIQTDVTEKLAWEDYLLEKKRAAEAANQQKNAFLAHISHEIRTPLSSILGYIELIDNKIITSHTRREYIRTIQRNAEHLKNLVGEILDFSKIEDEHLEIKRIMTPLFPEIEKIRKHYCKQHKYPNPDIEFILEITPPLPEVIFTDPIRFRQIVLNLIDNAYKYSDRGFVRVKFSMSKISPPDDKNELAVEISDSGRGIDPKKRNSIFEPFLQDRNIHFVEGAGTGLGLALGKSLAERLGGDVILKKSVVGEGSTFLLTIDCGKLENVRLINQGSISASNSLPISENCRKLSGIRVLLVEDSRDVANLVRISLEQWGAEVVACIDGEDALQRTSTQAFDIVLVDLQLPKMSGYDFLQKIKAVNVEIPSIAVTAHATLEEKRRSTKEGFDRFMTKPINFQELCEMIFELVLTKKMKSESESSPPLHSCFEHEPIVSKNLPSFIESTSTKLASCDSLVKAQNWVDLSRLCHQLKGSFGSFGYPEIQECAATMEKICQSELSDSEKSALICQPINEMHQLTNRARRAISTPSMETPLS